MSELWRLSAATIVGRLKAGILTVFDVLEALERRVAAVDGQINALPTLCFDRARAHANRLHQIPADKRGVLAGLPVAIKDLTAVAGVRTTMGSRVYQHHVPTRSCRLVQTIEADGGVIFAKSNTPEFGTGGITFNDVFGITRTPFNTAYAAGGSSGGAAASLAAGCSWLSHGSDMAGSLRTPAAFCGVTSLRPSPLTIVSDSEYLPFDVLGVEGPMARSVEDLALFADVMRDRHDEAMQRAIRSPELPRRVAVSVDLGVSAVSAPIRDAFSRFTDWLSDQGITVISAAPDLTGVHEGFDVLRANQYAVAFEHLLGAHADTMKPELVWNIEQGCRLSAEAIRQALRTQGQIVNRAVHFMTEYDLLICPAASVGGVEAHLRYPGSDSGVPVADYYRWLALACATTMTALPILTLPVGFLDNGLPFAVQLLARHNGEARLFAHAREIEQRLALSCVPIDPRNSGSPSDEH